jgi:organic hydroperoxide reductase OsmC/OhrA
MRLLLRADVPGLQPDRLQAIALQAKEHCMVSRLLNTTVTLDARPWVE